MDKELDRLQHLSSFALDYDSYHEKLEPFVELAKTITDSPVCEINIIDAYNQWTIGRTEKDLKVIPREESICHDTIEKNKPYEIKNLQKDKRYRDRDYVVGAPYFRYYCGVQLTTKAGVNVGSICVLDQKEKGISDKKKEHLQYLANLVVQYLQKDQLVYRSKGKLHDLQQRFRTLNHDLRSPVNGIVGIVDLLLTDEDEVEVSAEDLLMIKDCAEAIVDEIDSVLSPDKKTSNKSGSDNILLEGVFEKVKRLNAPPAQNKEISFKVESQTDNNYSISVYSSRKLIQIVSNLVANAIKFTDNGGRICVRYALVENDEQKVLKVIVEDNGIGMNGDKVDNFNSGEKVVGSSGTAGEESFGIGLQHVRQLVAELGGKISAESSIGEGTEFTVLVEAQNL
ncbi:hypothetical protein CK503_05515 [Aliifodinibius salipaludis]|uniref:histidine kinase n=1 Tax=Fodinibius salipaludis TaxID=2032627 RepID=A0A2A2GC53_9BACT|nr:HAMP domain-containing sensor histidine kinase [Aliifodinibius salipaludis]PAU94928.1 hypothetical protein CK503_05515 [Aliifodinibius salipaludis]